MKRAVALFFALACAAAMRAAASAEWRPPDVRATNASLAGVLAAYAKSAGTPDARFAQRREHWTYVNGAHRFAVQVAVRGDDFRASMALGAEPYSAGRSDAVRWRADANGITHATLSDDQGDAIDRLPQSVFPFAPRDCELAGESSRFKPAWVLVDRAPRDKPHWFYVDEATGAIEHEITREGARTVLTTFDRFEVAGGVRRPHHWRVRDGNPGDDLDVTVDAIEPEAVSEADVAIPQTRRVFAPAASVPNGVVTLPTRFRGTTIYVDVGLDGRTTPFVLDTGTASITLDAGVAAQRGWTPLLEHASVPRMTAGSLALTNVSTLAIPLFPGSHGPVGILGYDFFLGHVVHVDYARQRVEVMTPAAAEAVFSDPHTYVAGAYFDEGIPLVPAAFGTASGDRFALDTGSPHLFVLAPFARHYANEIAAHWSPTTFRGGRSSSAEVYLEGSIVVTARQAAVFAFGPGRFTNLTVGVEGDNDRSDAIDIPLDGIIGTDEMSALDWWFDYDGGRIAMRRNSLR